MNQLIPTLAIVRYGNGQKESLICSNVAVVDVCVLSEEFQNALGSCFEGQYLHGQ